KWVQIGNEVGNGILWPEGSSNNMSNFAGFIQSGYNAVKDIDSSIQVIVQLENGHKINRFREIFDGLKNNGAKWDIIGMSVYPYWAKLPWEEDNRLSLETMKDMISRYDTKVMVCEAGYLYYKPVEANHYLVDLIEKTKSVGGLGVFYWEPQSYNWGYKLGAWDPLTKKPTVALDAFSGLKVTALIEEKNFVTNFRLYQNYPNPFNPKTTIKYSLKSSGHVSLKVFNMSGQNIATLVDQIQNAGEYGLDFDASKLASGIYIYKLETANESLSRKMFLMK
ncbi:glycosyl hydrolase 53 family protein, partial [candidate division KSB1 bacterium]|nr:glycosyl hydrolase 53 family protein [candidate division KSB1 bacterium]